MSGSLFSCEDWTMMLPMARDCLASSRSAEAYGTLT